MRGWRATLPVYRPSFHTGRFPLRSDHDVYGDPVDLSIFTTAHFTMSAPSNASPRVGVYVHPKIFLIVLSHCDWPSLMAVSRSNTAGRSAVRIVVKREINGRIRPFVAVGSNAGAFLGNERECDDLLEMLHRRRGGIIGSTVRDMFGVNSPYDDDKHGPKRFQEGPEFLHTLQLVVPSGELMPCLSWFSSRGFQSWGNWPPRRQYSRTVSNYVFGEKEAPITHEVSL